MKRQRVVICMENMESSFVVPNSSHTNCLPIIMWPQHIFRNFTHITSQPPHIHYYIEMDIPVLHGKEQVDVIQPNPNHCHLEITSGFNEAWFYICMIPTVSENLKLQRPVQLRTAINWEDCLEGKQSCLTAKGFCNSPIATVEK